MKKILCLTIVLLSAISLFAQETGIEKAEFDAALKNRFRKFAGQSYRLTTLREDLPTETNKNITSSKSVSEFARFGGNRLLYEFDSRSLKTRMETITINGKTYIRQNDGEWTEKSVSGENEKPSAPERKFVTVEEQTQYKSLGAQILDKLNTFVYAKIEKKKLVNEADKKELFSTIVTKYWLDADGGIVKEETLTENQFKPSDSLFRSRRTAVWEFDPNIKIEAPVIAK